MLYCYSCNVFLIGQLYFFTTSYQNIKNFIKRVRHGATASNLP
ncbi:hypothetical protein HMPREF9554_00762 [Treponema phagedenis F0421]|nr:hypothetical protein HMPREF9554_00762 [Treponema phagedenis F0421]